MTTHKTPSWYDESKLVRIDYAADERGWAIDLGDGTYRLTNNPIESLWGGARWGDIVKVVETDEPDASFLEIIERYDAEEDEIPSEGE